jgi:DNA-binding NarL/FixJ family response regulator
LSGKEMFMQRHCVVLADSHLNMLRGVLDLLETMFEVVVMAADEKSLVAAIDKLKPDLVIADLSLGVSSEGNIARFLKKRYPELLFIILSIHDDSTVVEECLAAGTAGFVLKRKAAMDMIPAVREVLRGRKFISQWQRS